MARPSEKDPLDRFRWTVKIEGFTRVGFSQCGVPSVSFNTRTYAEGGAHLFPKKIIDSVEYKPITLTRGVTIDQSFNDWSSKVFELVRGKTEKANTEPESIQGQAAIPLEYRRDVVIEHRNRAGEITKKYILYNAIPIEYKPASDFQSDGDDVLSIETLVLAYEGFEVVSSSKDSNPADVSDIVKRGLRRGLKF